MTTMSIPEGYHPIEGSERRPSPTAKRIGPADPNELLTITISLRRRPDGAPAPSHDAPLGAGSAQPPRPSDEEFVRRYGASQEDIGKVSAFAVAHGLKV